MRDPSARSNRTKPSTDSLAPNILVIQYLRLTSQHRRINLLLRGRARKSTMEPCITEQSPPITARSKDKWPRCTNNLTHSHAAHNATIKYILVMFMSEIHHFPKYINFLLSLHTQMCIWRGMRPQYHHTYA